MPERRTRRSEPVRRAAQIRRVAEDPDRRGHDAWVVNPKNERRRRPQYTRPSAADSSSRELGAAPISYPRNLYMIYFLYNLRYYSIRLTASGFRHSGA